ncbi:MAG: hypothetical protein ACK4MX_01485 [Thermaurantiacus sp.]
MMRHANAAALPHALALALLLLPLPLAAQDAAPAERPAEAPRSLLPDLFDDPPARPGGPPQMPVPIVPDGPAPALPLPPVAALPPIPRAQEIEIVDPLADLGGPEGQPETAGLLGPGAMGYPPDLFAQSDARFVGTLLRGIEAPLASRWAQVMVQRALLSRTSPPPGLDPADWLAARAQALAAMGSATDAHRMVMRMALDRYTPRLYAVAGHVALAAGDPVALCPIAGTARALTRLPVWALAQGMCGAISGDDFAASMRLDAMRDRQAVNPFDVGLAERIGASAGGARRAANPEWDEADGLTAWRIGLASAAGLSIPDDKANAATLAQKAWMVRLPGQALARRAAFAPEVAATGVISAAELQRILAAEAATLDQGAVSRSAGGLLRTAMAAERTADRLAAMRTLWGRARPGTRAHYGWKVATTTAAAGIAPSADLNDDAPDLVESLLAGGRVAEARRWATPVASASETQRARVHVLLLAADRAQQANEDLVRAFARESSPHRAALMQAGLEGLGRLPASTAVAPLDNPWTRALDRARGGRRLGEVMLLAATAMQAGWANVPPDHLRRIAAALSELGHGAEAGLIVAEAAMRG